MNKSLVSCVKEHSGALHALRLHRIIEINLSFPMESNCGFGS